MFMPSIGLAKVNAYKGNYRSEANCNLLYVAVICPAINHSKEDFHKITSW